MIVLLKSKTTVISDTAVETNNKMNTILYNLLFTCFFDFLGVATKSFLLKIQIKIIPNINPKLIKFKKNSYIYKQYVNSIS